MHILVTVLLSNHTLPCHVNSPLKGGAPKGRSSFGAGAAPLQGDTLACATISHKRSALAKGGEDFLERFELTARGR
jgi:hypothetical protein